MFMKPKGNRIVLTFLYMKTDKRSAQLLLVTMSLFRQFTGMSVYTRVLVFFVLLWGFLVFIFASKLNTPTVSDSEYTMKRLNQAITFLEDSKKRNAELKALIDEYLSEKYYRPEQKKRLIDDIESKLIPSDALRKTINEPSTEYEQLRRRVQSNTQEMWNFVNAEMLKLKKTLSSNDARVTKQIDNMIEMAAEHKNSLLNDLNHLAEVDGYDAWRFKEAAALSDLVQRRLQYLQNPEDCNKAPKLVCRLNKGCGYGCQLHHVVYCFIMAYATERTLILKSKGWRYHKAGWEEVFKPISDTCLSADGSSHASWSGHIHNTQVVDLPIIDSLNPRPPYLPLAIPEDLAPRLKRLHGDPVTWWVGQFLKYLLRMQPDTQNMLDSGRQKLGFQRPIVGVHVRRTDKVGTEASLHSIEEYMTWVDDYFSKLEMTQTVEKRRVFLASDDPKVIEEARRKYPSYDIIGDPDVARMAAVSTRYTDSSLNGIIMDIHLLSMCDFLVCTFSSQVCRVAYEIMQAMYPDASNRFKSLDDIYYYGGQNAHNREAVLPHRPKNHDEIFMNVGDSVGVAGNHWDGFSKGKNERTNQAGLFPSFKVIDKVETADFPKYSNIK
ncbi:Alpha-(1,6)-fucosyltransferase [Pseudolycoriella hygida]|uniref:Alpha-(1,6)-fucosyltransferase n=1 Tax=Pseudolycoriella hygida TaxID=35572 RepID=A0A9Q0MQJ4_9DIPT|nr:Alpha-(1,6)-fucosyltransferase [Pseudolycoriella hygida]